MRRDEIVDANQDLREARLARRRRLFGYGIPIASVILMVAGLAGIAAYSYQSNRQDSLALSRDLLVVLEQQVRLEVAAHFKPADNAARVLAATVTATPFAADDRAAIERIGMYLLREAPMIALISIADADGNYLMLRRNPLGGIDTKLMERRDGQLTTTWFRRNAEDTITGIELDPDDTYDPRTRPWFSGALQAQDVSWSDAYVFFTDKKPGITASLAVRDHDGKPTTIIGVDIFLDDLSRFLASLRISDSSESMIVDEQARIIAQRHRPTIAEDGSEEFRLADVSELERPYVTEAYDRIRVTGPNRSLAEIDRGRYIILGSSLANIITRNWMLVFVVPESDFVGFVGQNTRNSLIVSGIVVMLALFMAALLIRQQMMTDRTMRTMRSRESDMGTRERGFAELGMLAGESDTDARQLPRFTEALARATKASSVRVWRFELHQTTASCLAAYDAETESHTSGIEIARDQIPELFAAIERGQEVVIDDVLKDPRLSEVRNLYLRNTSGRNLLLFPLIQRETVVGYLALENLPFHESTADATLLLLRGFSRWLTAHLPDSGFAAAASQPAARDSTIARAAGTQVRLEVQPAALRSASLTDQRQQLAMRRLGNGQEAGVARIFPQVTSLTVRIDLDAALPANGQSSEDLLQKVAEITRQSCERHAVRYLKIVANEIFAADGFEGEPEAAAGHIAEVAIELRDHCALLARRINRTPMIAMGLDTGATIGTPVGDDNDSYNLWGEAVQLGQTLAATATPGTIQVSQSAYEHLNNRFLFRRAGAYYLERIGEMTTYTLRGPL